MTKASKFALLAVAASLAACSDNMMAPPVEPSQASAEMDVQGSNQDLRPGEKITFSIRIDPSRNTYYYLGEGNSLRFPAGSLCDPNKSSYGESEWDKSCTKATSVLTVNVTAWLDSKGHARVDFDKHIRFVPSSDPSKWVVITFADMEAALDPFFNILYCPSSTSNCKDESKKDPSLLTVKNPLTGKVTRRIKHFSGYNVAAGRDAEEEERPGYWGAASQNRTDVRVAVVAPVILPKRIELFRINDRLVKRLSGYILASG